MQHGGNITRYQAEWGWRREDLADFSANLNPLGPPHSVMQAIREALSAIADYPDPHGNRVLSALAAEWHLPENRFLLGNGAAELIFLAMRLLRPKTIATLAPAFREYEQAARLEGAEILRIPLRAENGFLPEADQILPVLAKADLLVLANPNNPTGRCVPPDTLGELLQATKKTGTWMLVDEAFLDFLPDDEKRSLIPHIDSHHKLIVIRSLTKFYSIPGIRIGYLAAAGHLIKRLRQLQVPWSVNSLAQAAAVAALSDEGFRLKTLEWLAIERQYLMEQLVSRGYEVVPSDANFLLVWRPDIDIEQLWPQLAGKGLFVRDCRSFAGLDGTYFRIAIRSREENERLLWALP
ncbi:threonine-phosphate decarboxylase CobD [Effusibacillus lacus]|uniref:threonine-phosphate decarboxylase n=1 Tax=Effusibacillus lacus TaxID=1348429 RepID=A0A292YKD8_9BACL|nr:threonine-phosphate decarboxylase CobD [Effusibacillus lacus]TCS70834.1 L-threonine O-3-phosphate decarboxylase [Effusibacillus lacus]GAX89369.1 threonine-phosphate decarboxylase [Effusibacillus lacus]